MADGEYSVFAIDPDGNYLFIEKWLDPKTAMHTAKMLTEAVNRVGADRRVIITDGGDNTCFQWEYSKGITFPR